MTHPDKNNGLPEPEWSFGRLAVLIVGAELALFVLFYALLYEAAERAFSAGLLLTAGAIGVLMVIVAKYGRWK